MIPRTEQFKKRGRKPREAIEPRLLSPIQVAEFLGLSKALVTKMIAEGRIPGRIKMEGIRRNLFDKKVLDKWIDAGAPGIDSFENGK